MSGGRYESSIITNCIILSATRQASQSRSQKRKELIIDLILGVALPLIVIPLHIVVQGHRAGKCNDDVYLAKTDLFVEDVIQSFGCSAPIYLSIASIFLFQLWQIGLNAACCVYAGESV